MGESILDAPNLEDKMGETASSNPDLEVSVSFGRFANDSLSWEKWSSFSPNKYLEEVEKCATPGSVARKAAYFEAHYKKIAARKAELLDQEKQMDDEDHSESIDQSDGDLIRDNCRTTDSEFDLPECQSSNGGVVNQEISLVNEESGNLVNESNGDVVTSVVMCQSSSIGEIKEAEIRSESTNLDKQEEVEHVLVKEEEENGSIGMRVVKELQEREMEDNQKVKNETVKSDRPKESRKITPVNKDRNMSRIKKKPTSSITKASPIAKASPISKALPISTPKVSKPASTSTPVTSSRSSTKIANSSPLLRSKNFSAVESKKVAPKSLHISLSLGPSSSDPASLNTTRKSLIMEKMGDKDIVKRAFKTFQNNYNQLKPSGEERSPASKQVSVKGTEPRVSTSITPQKENGGSFKAASVEKKYAKAAPSSFALKSNERIEKRREVPKKMEEKSNAREADRRRLHTKPKEDKEAENKTTRQNHNFKSTSITSMPGFNRGKKITKGSVDKEGSKNEINR
ncbi:hypothetical protein EZV62_017696 [Acer yangbiense]|uniref:TPX2 C-terminal domain-containing protein n=1 Tax=Acer yangbiense TaxID=1000413 RepID=A0A5C7HH51_9ROSI|nr:hypothetical protein EZV62_017696 [Acer yangbiense]